MAPTSKTFRIFVSSTFSDLREERNALQRRVFPRLRDLCRKHGCRFQAIDLRWGVREEAALDQQTLRICLEEIQRCQRITPRPNFIILLGNRYGWRPLPAEIPADEYRLMKASVTAPDARQLLSDWYVQDDNAVPAVRVLQPRRLDVAPDATEDERRRVIDDEARAWHSTETRLRRICNEVVPTLPCSEEQRHKYRASATEQEIRSGALSVVDARDHVFCFLRELEQAPSGEAAGEYFDLDDAGRIDREAQGQLAALKDTLGRSLPATIFRYRARWAGHGPTLDHLNRFCDDVYDSLSRVMLAEIERMESIAPLDQEISDHETFAEARARVFVGRADALRTIADYLRGSDSRPLAVWGEPGLGKSALMARASALARAKHPAAEVVRRFVGVTPSSSDARALLESLCREITRAYHADDSGIPSEFRELAEEFPRRLALAQADRPLVVFIDALDQLSDAHYARRLAWLPATLPEHVRLVVSTLPGECQTALEGILVPDSLVRLQPMALEEGDTVLTLWLQSAGRTLQDHQRREVMGKFARDGRPLYLRLAFEEARRWRSYRSECELSPDIDGVIREFLERLSREANHGAVVVSRSLGYLAAARNGLTEDELLDLLSQDEAVFRDFLKRSFHEPPERRLPAIVWSRLFFDLEPYLAERSADSTSLLTFYHPTTIGRVVRDLYLSDQAKLERHGALADYFGRQQLFSDNQRTTANVRKLSELSYQLTEGQRWNELYDTLTDFEALEARCTHSGVTAGGSGEKAVRLYTGVYELMEDYRRALAVFPSV